MSNSTQITSSHKARLSKLTSKKTQLEQLLRKRNRLNYQIKILQKSISKEQKRIQKESSILEQIKKGEKPDGSTLIQELAVAESEDPEEVLESIPLLQKELDSILEMLLDFDETTEEN